MNQFSISDLQQFSGVKAHTIRIWELRYKALSPCRSEGNVRYYDDMQLRRLLNIVTLNSAGHKISKIGGLKDEQLFKLLEVELKSQLKTDNTEEQLIFQLIAAGVAYDDVHFEKIFSTCLLRYGMKNTYLKIIYPLLVRLGLMWAKNTIPPAQEHYITNIIQQKIFTAIDSLPAIKENTETWVLFLPEDEFHEIGLLFAHYTIRNLGVRSIYLGANIPFECLKTVVEEIEGNHLLYFLVHQNSSEKAQASLDQLTAHFKTQQICLAGNIELISSLNLSKQTQWLKSVEELEKVIQQKNV
ncbi:MAG: MerR family transcriptional regulator [Bacteroidia bacterium]